MKKNIRKYRRVNKNYKVMHYKIDWNSILHRSLHVGKTQNISAGGVLIETKKQYELGDLICLEFIIPEWDKIKNELLKNKKDESTTLTVVGRVIRIEENNTNNIGIEYQLTDKEQQKALNTYFDII